MNEKERIVNSALLDARRTLRTAAFPTNGTVHFLIRDTTVSGPSDISITPKDLVAALDGILPGLIVKYEPPVDLPKRVGSSVRSAQENTYVRAYTDSDSTRPWLSTVSGTFVASSLIEQMLREGGVVLRGDTD